jgi:hypothetical protein
MSATHSILLQIETGPACFTTLAQISMSRPLALTTLADVARAAHIKSAGAGAGALPPKD